MVIVVGVAYVVVSVPVVIMVVAMAALVMGLVSLVWVMWMHFACRCRLALLRNCRQRELS